MRHRLSASSTAIKIAAASTVLAALAAGCGGDDGGVEATSDDPPVTLADLDGQAAAEDGESSAVDRETEAVIEAHWSAMEARIESAAAPAPDPALPALEETHIDPRLGEWVSKLTGMANQGLAMRYPEDSELEVLDADVSFSWWTDDDDSGGAAEAGPEDVGDKATLRACLLDDGETFDVATGETTEGGGLYTIHETTTLRKVDGEWKVAEHQADRQWEGRDGCAAESE